MIQFWTQGDKIPSQNVTIRGNIMTVDDTPAMIQAIFLFNEEVQRNGAGTSMFYRNIVIEDNVVYGNHPHGIYVGSADGVTIRNNIVLNDSSNGQSKLGWHPEIDVDTSSKNVTITGNTANEITNKLSGWLVTNNNIVKVGTVAVIPDWNGGPTPSSQATASMTS